MPFTFRSDWDNRRVPSINADKNKTPASIQRIADVKAVEHGKFWINHDAAKRQTLKLAPQLCDESVPRMSSIGDSRKRTQASSRRCWDKGGQKLISTRDGAVENAAKQHRCVNRHRSPSTVSFARNLG
jgi:hypothetical protein